jgi:MSHA pilin protein MshC
MLELVVVLLIAGILATVALPRLTDRSALQERGARDQLRGLLHTARQTAVAQGRDLCVLIAADRARLVHTAGAACNPGLPVLGRDGTGALAVAMPAGVSLSGPAALRFGARGQLLAGSDVAIGVGSLGVVVHRDTGWVE